MATFNNFRKFNQIQDTLWGKTRGRLLQHNPREVRKARQMDEVGRPSKFNLGAASGRRAFWTQPTRQLAAGGYGMIMDPALVEDMMELAESAMPTAAASIDDIMGKWALKVRREWPYRTGVSQALLDLRVSILGETMIAEMLSRAPYTPHIRAKKLGKRRPDKVLLQKPGSRLSIAIGEDILRRLSA